MKRKFIFVLVFTLITSIFPIAVCSQTAYAILESHTLTFKYGSKPNVSYAWDLPEDDSTPGWISQCSNIYTVSFDASFSNARPQKCRWWFVGCENLTQINNIANLNTSETTDMYQMFCNCNRIESIDLTDFETYNVKNMCGMFSHCEKLEQLDLSSFNTTLVETMSDMFGSCTNLASIVFGSLFNTSKVKDMTGMFAWCTSLRRLDLSRFNTGNVENMNSMFRDCSLLYSVDLSSFNTSKVSDMIRMFQNCSALKRIDIHSFSTSSLTDTYSMFKDCTYLEKIVCDGDWSGVSESTDMFSGCTNLIGAAAYNSANTDATYANKTTGYFSPFYYYIAERSGDGKTLTFRRSATAPNGTTQWDATKSGYEEIDTNPNPDNDDYEPDYTFHGLGVEKVVFDESFADARPNSCYCWFIDNTSLTKIIGLEYLNTSEVINMENMFYRCTNLSSLDLRSFDVSNTEKMGQMFYQCTNLETIACDDDWNGNQVTSSAEMFWGCPKLKGAITYNSTKTNNTYANPTTGYFTSTANYKIDVTVPSYNICTYSSTYDLDFSSVSGLSAYVICDYNASEGTLTLSPATTVKAGEGLLLKGNAGEYAVPRTTTNTTYTNYLVGVPTTTSVSPTDGAYTNFILANGSYGVNFYPLSTTGDIAGGKAYLKLPTSSLSARMFSFTNGETTAIENINVFETTETTIYDLQGRKVDQPTKGLYILNGKKVIIK